MILFCGTITGEYPEDWESGMSTSSKSTNQNIELAPFVGRHIGPSERETNEMLDALGLNSLEGLVDGVIPPGIRSKTPLEIGPGEAESDLLNRLKKITSNNQVFRSYLGMGYHGCITPSVILRNIMENPGWYTQYTPYQAEIAQGRLEMLLNFQTMISDLTGLEVANASLLDEATAAAEAMTTARRISRLPVSANTFWVSDECHPQTIEVVRTRGEVLGIEVVVAPFKSLSLDDSIYGLLLPYPTTDGTVVDYEPICGQAKLKGIITSVVADILSLAVLRPPGEFGADIAVGSSQRLGVPMGFGGPHAAFFATKEAHKRQVPGRIVGVSRDTADRPALRLALQTREQHIRRNRATSNICTAQVLLAVMAAAYAVYHGPVGVRNIAVGILKRANGLRRALAAMGHSVQTGPIFDTVCVTPSGIDVANVMQSAVDRGINFRNLGAGRITISLDETVRDGDVEDILRCFGEVGPSIAELAGGGAGVADGGFARTSSYLTHPNFNSYHSETEMLRYLARLQAKDLSLTHSMIPLGSCTMKLNAATEMLPVTWPEIGGLHPFVPSDQAQGYHRIFSDLEEWLGDITGFDAVSLQPNAGSQGEYAGLLVIRAYHEARGDTDRNICLIPTSAHGTNPASAVMAGMDVVAVNCDDQGNIDVPALEEKAREYQDRLGALMITYPSTHGVFEEEITQICEIIHRYGGQVYLDGANMNAMVGLCRPADFGADVCHLNLHKTFCIPHGGGGPGMGPIGVKSHLEPFLPSHPVVEMGGEKALGPISAAPWGSPSILPISWMYIALMGSEGLTQASRVAILNANYMAKRLGPHYPILYRGRGGYVAHECILDLRPLKTSSGIGVDDVAKRLIDYGYHAPTMSWPVAGTLMIEPTESESKEELDRFCNAMIAIREEIKRVEEGGFDAEDNPLKNAPHTASVVIDDSWDHAYTRNGAVFPNEWVRGNKFWPPVGRVDNAYGDRNLICACPSVEELAINTAD